MRSGKPLDWRRLSHWAGLVLAAPIVIGALIAFYDWLRGGFPATVTAPDAVLVLILLFAAAALVYGVSRAIGWAVLTFAGRR